jgi:hypothetical protein
MNNNETINLFDVGCLVSLKIGAWSGRRMISRADLVSVGIDPSALPTELVNYGRKLLVSKSEIQAITKTEQRARYYLSQYSVPFGIANAFFVPNSLIPDVEHNLKEYKKEFFQTVDSFIVRFNDLKQQVKDKHPEFFEKCLKKFYPETPESLRSRFYFDWHLFKISGINSIENTSSEEISEKNKIIKEKMQKEANLFVTEYVEGMRSEVIRFCDLIKCRIDGTPYGEETEAKKLSPKTLTSFRKYIEKFKMLNIFGDSEIDTLLNQFKDQFLDAEFNGKTLESGALQQAILSSTSIIRKAASMENEATSQFIKSLKRKVVI